MDFQLTEDQEALVAALQSMLRDHSDVPQSERFSYAIHSETIQSLLQDNGFLDAARDIGPLEAALVVLESARQALFIETGATALVAPMALPGEHLAGPIALGRKETLHKAQRNLPIARTMLVDLGEDVAIVPLAAEAIEPVTSIYGFPYGRFRTPPAIQSARTIKGAGPAMRQWWRVALTLEIAGAAEAAIAFTLDYVKERHVFGRPVGSFQAVQHRLVQCHAYAVATRYLALRAAWSQDPAHADFAACHAQQGVQKLMFDLHQFHGGMGVTTEHMLHLWTYRVRALQAEAGGVYGAALDIARTLLPSDLAEAPAFDTAVRA
jgi:hypothetical protein